MSVAMDLGNRWTITVKLYIGHKMVLGYFSTLPYPFEYRDVRC